MRRHGQRRRVAPRRAVEVVERREPRLRDGDQVRVVRRLAHEELREPRPHGGRQLALAGVAARVHRREHPKRTVDVPALEHGQQMLEDVARREVDLVEQDPVALRRRVREGGRHEREGQAVRLGAALLEDLGLRREAGPAGRLAGVELPALRTLRVRVAGLRRAARDLGPVRRREGPI